MSYFNDPSSLSEARLQAVQGYLELGMYPEAWTELEGVERAFPASPSTVGMRVQLLMKERRWADAFEESRELRRMLPHGGAGYIHGAFCLHELCRTEEALELLESAPEPVRGQAIFYYNKGCYQAALGRVETAHSCLMRSFDLDHNLLDVARHDPDLVVLRDVLI